MIPEGLTRERIIGGFDWEPSIAHNYLQVHICVNDEESGLFIRRVAHSRFLVVRGSVPFCRDADKILSKRPIAIFIVKRGNSVFTGWQSFEYHLGRAG